MNIGTGDHARGCDVWNPEQDGREIHGNGYARGSDFREHVLEGDSVARSDLACVHMYGASRAPGQDGVAYEEDDPVDEEDEEEVSIGLACIAGASRVGWGEGEDGEGEDGGVYPEKGGGCGDPLSWECVSVTRDCVVLVDGRDCHVTAVEDDEDVEETGPDAAEEGRVN